MRRFVTAIALWLGIVGSAGAFETEEARVFGQGATEVRVLSTIDVEVFAPVLEAFLDRRPDWRVTYVAASSQEVFKAIVEEQVAFDLVISSAMDLQMKMANDGYAMALPSAMVSGTPSWARWRDILVAIAQEPVVAVLNRSAFADVPLPDTRSELANVLRQNPELFRGRVGTYDPNTSGAGYLFATQDARYSDTFWRLSEIMGSLDAQLFSASSGMISAVENGSLAVAYNVVGSYAASRLAGNDETLIVEFRDFTHVLLRTALIPVTSDQPESGRSLLEYLLSEEGQAMIETRALLPRLSEAGLAARPHQKPIRLDPGLLVYVDPLKRQRFLSEWSSAVVQP